MIMDFIRILGDSRPSRYHVMKGKGPFLTPAKQLDQGMCVCSDCGFMCSADYRWCDWCRQHVVILVEETVAKHERSRERKEKKVKSK